MREIVHIQAGQCGNQIGAKVSDKQRNGLKVTRKVIDSASKPRDEKNFAGTDGRQKEENNEKFHRSECEADGWCFIDFRLGKRSPFGEKSIKS